MERGNVLVIGNSGAGKTTLIDAVLGENKVKTGWEIKGTAGQLEVYESNEMPFRLIETAGFGQPRKKVAQAISAVRKWSKERAKENDPDTNINMIWFCVEGTSGKGFGEAIDAMKKATREWKSVPIIVVITKSYSAPDRAKNIERVKRAFKRSRRAESLKKIIPVVAKTFALNENAYAAPEGITELIDVTNELMPEGVRASAKDVEAFKLNRKRTFAQGLVGSATAAAVVVGAVPIPFADALILTPIEVTEINAIAKLYGIKKNENTKRFLNTIIEVGTVGVAAKAAISAIKAIPGVNIGASVLNAVIAGSIVASLGEGAIYAFEQVYLGKKSFNDVDWLKKIMESRFTGDFVKRINEVLKSISKNPSKKEILEAIGKFFKDTYISLIK